VGDIRNIEIAPSSRVEVNLYTNHGSGSKLSIIP